MKFLQAHIELRKIHFRLLQFLTFLLPATQPTAVATKNNTYKISTYWHANDNTHPRTRYTTTVVPLKLNATPSKWYFLATSMNNLNRSYLHRRVTVTLLPPTHILVVAHNIVIIIFAFLLPVVKSLCCLYIRFLHFFCHIRVSIFIPCETTSEPWNGWGQARVSTNYLTLC